MRRSALLSLLALAACAAEPPIAPSGVASLVQRSNPVARSQVHPASSYAIRVVFPGKLSDARDINNAGQVVGFVKTYAFLHELASGKTWLLPDGGADTAQANAINQGGVVGGWVARPTRTPTVWTTPTSTVHHKAIGEVLDLNDRAEAVGWTLDARGVSQALYWDVNRRLAISLPLPKGASWARANGINNDRVIVGESDVGGVLWTGGPGSFRARRLKGIRPLAVDHGMGTVGDDGNPVLPNALYGSPDSTGTFGWGASAENVNGYGVAAGVAYAFWYPFEAFVADRHGAATVLPTGAFVVRASAHALNDCGMVAGNIWFGSVPEAVVWDPGC